MISATEKRAKELSKIVATFSQGRAKSKPIDAKKNLDYLNKITGLNIPKKKAAPKPFSFVARVEGGAPGTDGAPGKDAVINIEEITNAVIEKLKKDKALVVSDLKDGQAFVFNNTKYGTHEMMHGGGSTTSSTTAVYSEAVSGSGTSWTLAHTPTTGTLQLYGNGQRLTLTNDYTLSGTTITTTNSFSSGTLLADYTY